MLIQLLCFCTLSIVLLLFKTHNVSETGFCLRLQVEPTQLGPVDRASPNVLELELRLQVEPTQLGPVDRASPSVLELELRLQVEPTQLGPVDRASPSVLMLVGHAFLILLTSR
jgi:hypothetical protein